MDYDAFVVNLDRQTDRYAAFVRANSGCGIKIERFSAVDGSGLDAAAREEIAAPEVRLTPGALGCALSHRALWHRASLTGRTTLVVEDDVRLRDDVSLALKRAMASLGSSWDLLLLGFNTDGEVLAIRDGKMASFRGYPPHPNPDFIAKFARTRDAPATYPLVSAFGTCAYVVTPEGASRLLETVFPIRTVRAVTLGGAEQLVVPLGIDGAMSAFYRTMRAFVCLPALAMTQNDTKTSTTIGVVQVLTELMRRHRLTAAEIAAVLSVSAETIDRWLDTGAQDDFVWIDATGKTGLLSVLLHWIDTGNPPEQADLVAIRRPDADKT